MDRCRLCILSTTFYKTTINRCLVDVFNVCGQPGVQLDPSLKNQYLSQIIYNTTQKNYLQ